MPREHNTNNEDMPQLPEVAIILAGIGASSLEKTEDSVQEQSYKNVTVFQSKDSPVTSFFNNMNKAHKIYGLMSAGDTFASNDSLRDIVDKLLENKFIGGVYGDACVSKDGLTQEFYLPPHDHRTFSGLTGAFPVFFKLEAMQDNTLDENLKYLYGHDILVKISSSFIVSHMPKLLFNLTSKQVDIEEDANYLRNNNVS